MRKRFLFFVYSNFHYIICKNIISQLNLCKEDCYFIVERDVKIEDCHILLPRWYSFFILSDNPVKKLLLYWKHKKEILASFSGYGVSFYCPFSFKYPHFSLCDVSFIEEGFSSYMKNADIKEPVSFSLKVRGIIKGFITRFLGCVSNGTLQLFVAGLCFSQDKPEHNAIIYTLSEHSYQSVNSPYIKRIVISNSITTPVDNCIPEGSFMLVLDRFSEGGRPYSLRNYMTCLTREMKWIIENNVTKIYVRFHPVDDSKTELKNVFFSFVKDFPLIVEEFKGNLEYLAIQNIGIRFFGTNSTILFYAPLLGENNKSFSFSRYLYDKDENYRQFMTQFGGIDDFINVFSENVTCL